MRNVNQHARARELLLTWAHRILHSNVHPQSAVVCKTQSHYEQILAAWWVLEDQGRPVDSKVSISLAPNSTQISTYNTKP